MSNFTFLNNDWPGLYATACEVELNVNSALRTGFDSAPPPLIARCSLERAVRTPPLTKACCLDHLSPACTTKADGILVDNKATRIFHLLQEIELRAA